VAEVGLRGEIRLKIILMILSAVTVFCFTFAYSAFASDISNGSKIFNDNCAACHLGGGNILIAEKTLHKEALSEYLENYSTDSISAIINQIKNGKNAMPAYKSKLSEQEILEVSAYVFQKSENGWEKTQEIVQSLNLSS
jgi:cytochrome c6